MSDVLCNSISFLAKLESMMRSYVSKNVVNGFVKAYPTCFSASMCGYHLESVYTFVHSLPFPNTINTMPPLITKLTSEI